jgi:hypothetical protein
MGRNRASASSGVDGWLLEGGMGFRLPVAWLIAAAVRLASESMRPQLDPGFAADLVDVYWVTPSFLQTASFWCFVFAAFYCAANLTAPERLNRALGWTHFALGFIGWALIEAAPHLSALAGERGPQGWLALYRALNTASFVGACFGAAAFAAFVGVVLLMLFGPRRDQSVV